MIDFKAQIIGAEDVARTFAAGPGAIRQVLRAELARIGDEVVARAAANAPKRTGVLAERIKWYFGTEASARDMRKRGLASKYVDSSESYGDILFTVRPTGSVAHLIERGVHGPRKQHPRRVSRTAAIWTRKGEKTKTFKATTLVKAHPFHIPARPFFTPAVDSIGGSAGINARLQKALEAAPALMQGAA